MLRNYAIITLALLLVASYVYSTFQMTQLNEARAQRRAIALHASNVEALHDTTHSLGPIGDTAHAFGRRVVQVAQPHSRAAEYAIGVALNPLHATATVPTSDSMSFRIRDEPFTVAAFVSAGGTRDSTALAVHVSIDTIHLVARIECDAKDDVGVSVARIRTTAPPWAAVRFGDVQQAPEVCNPPRPEPIQHRSFISWAPLVLSVGRQIGPGANGWTAQIGTAITFGAR